MARHRDRARAGPGDRSAAGHRERREAGKPIAFEERSHARGAETGPRGAGRMREIPDVLEKSVRRTRDVTIAPDGSLDVAAGSLIVRDR